LDYFLYLIWDPNPIFFKVPFINFAIRWYGFFFALGFALSYFCTKRILKAVVEGADPHALDADEQATKLCDLLGVTVCLAAVVGARIGYILFYDLFYYLDHPFAILNIRQGGLASHGAMMLISALLLAFPYFVKKTYPYFSRLMAFDTLVISVPLAGGCIRLGNFMNQEITGTPTHMPWGVAFMHPLDNVSGLAVHPVQLYEALFYFALFGLFIFLWSKRIFKVGQGIYTGLFFTLLFGFRFLIEFFKTPQGVMLPESFPLRMGQVLSLPAIAFGLLFLFYSLKAHRHVTES
jgi:phosphatidylglycerol---prolipoprotein diacylglyceryl transferase